MYGLCRQAAIYNEMKIQLQDIPTKGYCPILSYCRQLIRDGINPKERLEVYRGDILAITVKNIKIGAGLSVKDNKYGTPVFIKLDKYSHSLLH
jgi:hypothetical protein